MQPGFKVQVGVLGLGNVGSGVVRILHENAEHIRARLGAEIELRRVSVRDRNKPRRISLDDWRLAERLTVEPREILEDPDIHVVVELIGGVEPARGYVLAALAAGKRVVTANKALIATCGSELFAAAAEQGLDIGFEASVAGGVPIIRTLRESLASDRVERLSGIINGTCNFILTEMEDKGLSFDAVVEAAQEAGYAEADPSMDVDGIDAQQKLAILARLAFGTEIDAEKIYVEGIRDVRRDDIRLAAQMGYRIKLLGLARRRGDEVEARVHPTLIPRDSLLAQVGGAYNGVSVRSAALGDTLYYGQGAGMMPTGSAVVADIIEAARKVIMSQAGEAPPPLLGASLPTLPLRAMADSHSRYMLTFRVPDRPGVLATIAGLLGERDVSIAQVHQDERANGGGAVPIVIITHDAREGDVALALEEIERREVTLAPTRLLRIER